MTILFGLKEYVIKHKGTDSAQALKIEAEHVYLQKLLNGYR